LCLQVGIQIAATDHSLDISSEFLHCRDAGAGSPAPGRVIVGDIIRLQRAGLCRRLLGGRQRVSRRGLSIRAPLIAEQSCLLFDAFNRHAREVLK
jgi:hypothetical protein